jgi:hypothetical protein
MVTIEATGGADWVKGVAGATVVIVGAATTMMPVEVDEEVEGPVSSVTVTV